MPPKESAEVVSARNALNRQSGHFKTASDTLERALYGLNEDFEVRASRVSADNLDDLLDALKTQYGRVSAKFEDYCESGVDTEAIDTMTETYNKLSKAYSILRERTVQALTRIETILARPTGDGGGGGNRDAEVRIQGQLKPNKLPSDSTLIEFERWRDQYTAYYQASNMDKLPIQGAQTTFLNCIDDSLERKVRNRSRATTTVIGGGSLMEMVEEIITGQDPIQVRRHRFLTFLQPKGQKFSDTMAHVESLASTAELARMTPDQWLTYGCLRACEDKALRQRFLEHETEPTMAILRRITANHEATQTTARQMDKAGAANTASAGRGRSKSRRRSPSSSGRGRSQSRDRGKGQGGQVKAHNVRLPTGMCWRCGDQGHNSKQCDKHPDSLTCSYCKKKGHLIAVCKNKIADEKNKQQKNQNRGRSRGRSQGRGNRSPSPSPGRGRFKNVNANHVQAGSITASANSLEDIGLPTPYATVTFAGRGKGNIKRTSFQCHEVVPDTGATDTVVQKKLIEESGIRIDTSVRSTLKVADGNDLPIVGVCHLTAYYQDVESKVTALVCAGLVPQCLLGWRDMKKLRMIPEEFPARIKSAKCITDNLAYTRPEVEHRAEKERRRQALTGKHEAAADASILEKEADQENTVTQSQQAADEEQEAKVRLQAISKAIARLDRENEERKKSWEDNEDDGDAKNVSFFIKDENSEDYEGLRLALLRDYADRFSDGLVKREPIRGALLKIHLKEDARPFKINVPKATPIHYKDAADRMVKELVESEVIERVPANETTEWCSRGFFVPKPNGAVRMVVDFTKLNEFSIRSPKPLPSTRDILQNLEPDAQVFSTLDLTQGYHQVMLDPESKHLTTFMLESGRWRFLRGPMGLNGTGDSFCSATDRAFDGHQGTQKLVDDGLTGARNLKHLEQRLRALLDSCREYSITLSPKKFKIGPEVKFAGHIIGADGVKPDPEKIESIRNFPTPTNLTEVRSFLGLANTLGSFLPDLTHVCRPIHDLTRKNVPFVWGIDQENAFQQAKTLLTSNMVVKPFDPNMKTILITDASRIGLGYLLCQTPKSGPEELRLVRCGSRSLVPAEKNYAPTELEALGIFFAVIHCKHYLEGCPDVEVRTDHKALVPMWTKDLADLPNARVLRFRERLQHFDLNVVYIPGKKNLMADALSRNPQTTTEFTTTEISNVNWCSSVTAWSDQDFILARDIFVRVAQVDNSLSSLIADRDDDYMVLSNAIRQQDPTAAPDGITEDVFNNLSLLGTDDKALIVYNANRLYVPKPSRRRILRSLHAGHCGFARTHKLACQSLWWPGMSNDIQTMIDHCTQCRALKPAQQREKANTEMKKRADELYPMAEVAVDLFHAAGHEYLVMVDRFSGFPFVKKLFSTTTKAITDALMNWFAVEGYPGRILSDGGPQFLGPFNEFCRSHGIDHALSSAFNPESNGLAEAAVKNCKHLLLKCIDDGSDFNDALLTWRTTPKANGPSPASLFRHRALKTALPSLDATRKFHTTSEMRSMVEQRQKQFDITTERVNDRGNDLEPIEDGIRVDVKDPKHRGWILDAADILHMRDDGHSYVLRDATSGRTFVRNRAMVRPATSRRERHSTESAIQQLPPALSTRSKSKSRKLRFALGGEDSGHGQAEECQLSFRSANALECRAGEFLSSLLGPKVPSTSSPNSSAASISPCLPPASSSPASSSPATPAAQASSSPRMCQSTASGSAHTMSCRSFTDSAATPGTALRTTCAPSPTVTRSGTTRRWRWQAVTISSPTTPSTDASRLALASSAPPSRTTDALGSSAGHSPPSPMAGSRGTQRPLPARWGQRSAASLATAERPPRPRWAQLAGSRS